MYYVDNYVSGSQASVKGPYKTLADARRNRPKAPGETRKFTKAAAVGYDSIMDELKTHGEVKAVESWVIGDSDDYITIYSVKK